MPAAVFDAAQGSEWIERREACPQKAAPVVRRHSVQRVDHVVERVGDDFRRSTFAAVECVTEIVHRTLTLGCLPDDGIRLQPDERAFRAEIDAAARLLPLVRRGVERGGGSRSVLEVAPGAAVPVIHLRGDRRQPIVAPFGVQ